MLKIAGQRLFTMFVINYHHYMHGYPQIYLHKSIALMMINKFYMEISKQNWVAISRHHPLAVFVPAPSIIINKV